MRNTFFVQTQVIDYDNGSKSHGQRVQHKEEEIQTRGMKILSSGTTITPYPSGVGAAGLLYLTTFLVEKLYPKPPDGVGE